MISFPCPNCNKMLHVDDAHAGVQGTCKKCGATIWAPAESMPPPPPPTTGTGKGIAGAVFAAGCLTMIGGCIVVGILGSLSATPPAEPPRSEAVAVTPAMEIDDEPGDWGISLERGVTYSVSRQTPLLQQPGRLPEGTSMTGALSAIASIEQLIAGGAFRVVDWTDEGNGRWYHVDVWDAKGSQARRYIDRVALIGQDLNPLEPTQVAPRSTADAPEVRSSHPAQRSNVVEGPSGSVYIAPTGTKYHRQSCRTLKGDMRPLSVEAARGLGYEPCKVCNPR
jgi:hypothetical protein